MITYGQELKMRAKGNVAHMVQKLSRMALDFEGAELGQIEVAKKALDVLYRMLPGEAPADTED